jgi:hypothetical protein
MDRYDYRPVGGMAAWGPARAWLGGGPGCARRPPSPWSIAFTVVLLIALGTAVYLAVEQPPDGEDVLHAERAYVEEQECFTQQRRWEAWAIADEQARDDFATTADVIEDPDALDDAAYPALPDPVDAHCPDPHGEFILLEGRTECTKHGPYRDARN